MSDPIYYRAGYKYQLDRDFLFRHGLTPCPPSCALEHEFLTLTADGYLLIKAGYAWDGPSGPTADTPRTMKASLVHDALYQLMRDGVLDRKVYKDQADQWLKKLMIEAGESWLRSQVWYLAVSYGGWGATYPYANLVQTAP